MEVQGLRPVEEQKQEVQIRLFSKDDQEKTDALPEISISGDVKRLGLSQLVNQLLSNEQIIPYDFLVNENFLRGSLEEHCRTHMISRENVLDVEYIRAFVLPDESESEPHPDWISSISYDSKLVATGCYDGIARVYNLSSNSQWRSLELPRHSKPVKSVKLFNGGEYLVSGSLDRSLQLCQLNPTTGDSWTLAFEEEAHKEGIESVETLNESKDLDSLRLATGSWDCTISIWSIGEKNGDQDGESTPKAIKSKTEQVSIPTKSFVEKLSITQSHTDVVSCVHWPHAMALYSASWDGVLSQFDITQASGSTTPVHTWNTPSAIACCSFSSSRSLLAAGHSDRRVRLYDPRATATSIVHKELQAHTGGWITDIAWSPTSSYRLASCGHDGQLNVWDIRSSLPLYSTKCHLESSPGTPEKLLALEWTRNNTVFIGGQAAKLLCYSLSGNTPGGVSS